MEKSLLNTLRLPARLDVHQTAERLGFQEYEIAVLMRLGMLHPLGNPAPNGHKWFATVVVEQCAADESWLDKATKAVARYFRTKGHGPSKSQNPQRGCLPPSLRQGNEHQKANPSTTGSHGQHSLISATI